jgi:DNA-binding response OmpR family regulator
MGQLVKFPARKPGEEERAAGEAPGKKLTILVAEDHGSLRDIVSLHLRHHGYHIRTANDGKAALDILAVEKVHLVLLDLMLPQVDGFEVLRRLQEEKEDTSPYVIVISARTTEEDVKRVLKLGGNEYLTKPFHLSPLLERIQAVEARLLSSQLPKD